MIKKIICQLWNQRRMNGWIFIELVIVSFFLWTVVDPIYVLTATGLIDPGYDAHEKYVVKIDAYDASNTNYQQEMATDSLNKEAYSRIIRVVRELPEVKDFSVASTASFPNCGSWNGAQIFSDTANIENDKYVHTQYYEMYMQDGSNMFRTYGMKDAFTGEEIHIPADVATRHKVFVSESLARALCGKTDAVGQKIYFRNKNSFEIAGVFKDYKHRKYEQPYPLLVWAYSEIEGNTYMHWRYSITFSLKEGVDADVFEQRFNKEVMPQLKAGNFYCAGLQSFEEVSYLYAQRSGVINQLRLKYSLAGFALLCIFLGMVGTFWIRCNARRQEIGIMRSMGASENSVRNQFLTEAFLLVTVAFVAALPAVVHLVHETGFATFSSGGGMAGYNMSLWQNQPVAHFCIITLITYIILLVIALIGTYIPVKRASHILPADALRDE